MGSGRWDAGAWAAYSSASVAGKSTATLFKSTDMQPDYDPAQIAVRESRDSVDNPLSTPIILAADVTASMGMIADFLMREGLNTLATEIYDRKPVNDPHIMVAAVGDAEVDRSPLQVTQFEADIRIAKQVTDLFLERGGGPNRGESYLLPHLFAARKVKTDAFEKRRKKGYLFSIGDEPFLDGVTKTQAAKFLGLQEKKDLSAKEIVALLDPMFEIYHVIIGEKASRRSDYRMQLAEWNDLLPQKVIILDDYKMLAETVVSAIQINEGVSKDVVAGSWDGSTAVVVANAVKSLAQKTASRGVQRL